MEFLHSSLFENIFVFVTLLLSSGYIFRRLHRMGQAHKRKESACGSCSSGTCAPVQSKTEKGETPLPLR